MRESRRVAARDGRAGMRLPNIKRLFLRARPRGTGSLTRRMIVVSVLWISVLLGGGGYALDRIMTSVITQNFDAQIDNVLTALIAAAEIGPEGEVYLNRPPANQGFLEPYSGLYFQIKALNPPCLLYTSDACRRRG